ncbi:prepilin-type N-terminal cleavage/methylation domain-containing protein [Luteimonas sp. SJ-92]|uniref:Prepilin-type N-terminal cleavage/methylation domain-containing protein n=1 Tax=Luteimonas salinisoli TaxID=2752307 RepID=A0A853J7Z9_9GAMM|nr:prepilin-type N-terminal cleavage/methylation domain-containing protein [Luteimonas salinisoli]NZA24819.1 prepilin-type N-terminal cleavage/methylation domain-containing protein [Luteimonas salinisoli]
MSGGRGMGVRQRGFSLVELAVAVVILGVVGILLARWVGAAAVEQRNVTGRDLMVRADDALLAYAMVNGRLPCPAVDGAGSESCAASVGWLPYATLGLPDERAGRIRYGVLRRADADQEHDADLAVLRDRPRPLQVSGDEGIGLPLGTRNGLDLCHALREAMRLPADPTFVHTRREDQPGVVAQNVAYALAAPTVPEGLAPIHRGSSPAFASPRQPGSADYHDQVLATGNDQLWTRMRCGDNLAPAAYAHFNAAAAAEVHLKALRDYKRQLEVARQLAIAAQISADAAAVAGAAQIVSAAAGVLDAAAESLASTGAISYRVGLAAAAVAAAAATEAAAIAFVVTSAIALDEARELYRDIDGPIANSAALAPLVLENAKSADAAGIYAVP